MESIQSGISLKSLPPTATQHEILDDRKSWSENYVLKNDAYAQIQAMTRRIYPSLTTTNSD
ncbi:MAG: hypothetical protein EVB04_02920 [Candidatus Thioglobus sp.]|nr:MAG: hypothetical protein EVB04_02920 [Candidatus Thioglobus sp.]